MGRISAYNNLLSFFDFNLDESKKEPVKSNRWTYQFNAVLNDKNCGRFQMKKPCQMSVYLDAVF